VVALGHTLRQLQTTARVLHVGAHPDDEDSALLAYLARGRGVRTAYLSLNRGEGGQNSLGPELYEALGVLRTSELLAARRLDGAEQYFARAFDFGFSKTAEETLAKWGHDEILADVVRCVRQFRPHVIVSRFRGDPSDGHGHHQAAGQLTREAFFAAADPSRFPEQITEEGLFPWQALKLYTRAAWDSSDATLRINTGEYDPLYGRSGYEIAMAGRSQHRCQNMGRLEAHGAQFSTLKLLTVADGVPRMAQEKDLFDGLDLSLTGAGKGDSGAVQQRLAKVERIVEQLNRALHPTRLRPVRDGLEVCLRDLRAAMAEIDGEEEGRARKGTEGAFGTRKHEDTRRHEGTSSGPLVPSVPSAAIQAALAQKEAEASRGLALAAGLQFDALADDAWITPGQAVTVTQQLFAPDEVPIRDVSFALLLPPGWSSTETAPPSLPDGPARARAGWSVRVADTAEPSGPYWLRTPRRGDRFDWPAVAYRGEPFQPPPLRGVVELTLGQTRLRLEQPVQYRYAQPDRGEVRQEVQVVPTLGVWIEPRLRIVPGKKGREGEGRGNWETGKLGNWGAKQGKLGNQTRPPEPNFLISQFPSATSGTSEFTLRVRNFSRTPQRGELILSVEGGSGGNPVSLPRPVKFDLNGEDAEATATVTVALPDVETPTDWVFRARARTDAGDLEPLRKMAQSGADILSASRRDVCSTDFSDRLLAARR
jgi:LmbE family N-acetylglucosaminyl deacetylase